MFGVLITIHEFGHFIVARMCKVKINEFSIGMGPKILSKTAKKSGIVYSLRALPLGGYVSMEGESEQSDNENSFYKKPAWQRLLISVAGPFMNILLGFLMTVVLVVTSLDANGDIVMLSTTVGEFHKNAVSDDCGLQIGDEIIRVGGVNVHTGVELMYEIGMQGSEPLEPQEGDEHTFVAVDLTVKRGGTTVVLNDVRFYADSGEGFIMGSPDFKVYRDPVNFGNVIKHSFFRGVSSVKMVWDTLTGLFTGRFGFQAVSGPIGTTEAIATAASDGWYPLIYFFTIISINLGIMNMLPLLPLDGGHIVFHLYEIIVRKPAPEKLRNALQLAGVVLLFGLMIVVAFKDIIGLFN